jgi:glycyl-tRNA synthetase
VIPKNNKKKYFCGMANDNETFKKIISHAKEYGFVFPSSEIYDGLSAVYDYGQNGVALKNNIREYWWKSMVQLHENIVGIDAAIFMHPTTWKASGHVDAFNDPLIDNKDSKKRYRADVLVEDYVAKIEAKIEKEVAKAASVLEINLINSNFCKPILECWTIKKKQPPFSNVWDSL